MATLTQDVVDMIYSKLTACDKDLTKMFARAAIRQATEVKVDMWNEMEDDLKNRPLFDENDIRAHAGDFTTDMLADFGSNVNEAIKAQQFNAGLDKVIEYSLKFD